jgi:ABC-type transport system substrate-binding protein
MTPWKTVSPINTPTWSMERNPYFWAVDTAGNQLPYIDRITMTLAENIEVANLRAIAGEYDVQERHMGLAKLPVFLENAKKGNYTVHLDPALNGSDATIHIGNAYEGDPEIAKFLKNKDFRHALSLGIDRDQLNEAFWLGVGTPGSIAPAPDTIYSPGAEWNKKYATLDLKQANELLDKVGLSKKDSEGYRLRTDGKGRLRLELVTVGGQFVPYTPVGEMIKQQWRKIGIDLDVKELERNLAFTRDNNNENQMITWANDGSEQLYPVPTPRAAGGRCGSTHGDGVRQVVRIAGSLRKEAGGPGNAPCLRSLPRSLRRVGRKARRQREGDLEDCRRADVEHRHGRPVAGRHGRPPREEQHGQRSRANGERTACPDSALVDADHVLLQVVSRASRPHERRRAAAITPGAAQRVE